MLFRAYICNTLFFIKIVMKTIVHWFLWGTHKKKKNTQGWLSQLWDHRKYFNLHLVPSFCCLEPSFHSHIVESDHVSLPHKSLHCLSITCRKKLRLLSTAHTALQDSATHPPPPTHTYSMFQLEQVTFYLHILFLVEHSPLCKSFGWTNLHG